MQDNITAMSFDKLKGIGKARGVVESGSSSELESLICVGEDLLAGRLVKLWNSQRNYPNVVAAAKERLDHVRYTAADLNAFILSKANGEYTRKQEGTLGMLTGAMLEILAAHEHDEGRVSDVTISGNGAEFHHLFTGARNIGNLTVRDFTGRHICRNIAAYGSRAGRIVLENIQGDSVASCAGAEGGSIDSLVFIGCKGNKAGENAGTQRGRTGHLIFAYHDGNQAGARAASVRGSIDLALSVNGSGRGLFEGAAHNRGRIGVVSIANHRGKDPAKEVAKGSRGGLLTITDTESDGAAYCAGIDGSIGMVYLARVKGYNAGGSIAWKGSAKTVLIAECEGQQIACGLGMARGKVGKVYLLDNKGEDMALHFALDGTVDHLYYGGPVKTSYKKEGFGESEAVIGRHYRYDDVIRQAYEAEVARYRLDEITETAKALATRDAAELIRAAETIKGIYDSVKGDI